MENTVGNSSCGNWTVARLIWKAGGVGRFGRKPKCGRTLDWTEEVSLEQLDLNLELRKMRVGNTSGGYFGTNGLSIGNELG